MYRNTIVEIIATKYKEFTKTEAIVADYFINNLIKDDFSSRNVIAKLFVSESTLSRFAQKCGFRGYREFVYRYEESLVEKDNDLSANMEHVLNSYDELIGQLRRIDENQIKRFVKLILQAKTIYVFGVGSSGLAAKEMENRFLRLGIKMEAVTDIDEMRMKLIFLDKNSLLIGMSISAEKKDLCFIMDHAKTFHAKTVLLTSNKTIDNLYCDERIICPTFIEMAQGNVISRQFPLLVIIDICYNYYVSIKDNLDERLEIHKKIVEVLKQI